MLPYKEGGWGLYKRSATSGAQLPLETTTVARQHIGRLRRTSGYPSRASGLWLPESVWELRWVTAVPAEMRRPRKKASVCIWLSCPSHRIASHRFYLSLSVVEGKNKTRAPLQVLGSWTGPSTRPTGCTLFRRRVPYADRGLPFSSPCLGP